MKFGYTIVYVPSVADALAFYEKAFGFQIRFLHKSGQYGELESGSTKLAFASHAVGKMNLGGNFVPVSAAATPPGIELAFVTEDVASAYAKAVAAQVPCHSTLLHRSLGGRLSRLFVRRRAHSLSCVPTLTANPAFERTCAKSRSDPH